MTLQEMKQMKQEHGYSDSHIAELSGIPVETV
jgi:DNA-directed RNA polymerase specialized sigma24 family protein